MKVGIDITPITKDKAGVGYLTSSFLIALIEIDSENEYYLFTYNDESAKEIKQNIELTSNFKLKIIKESKPGISWMLKCRKFIKEENLDWFISTSYLFWSIILPNTLQFIHDIAPVKYPQFFTRKGSLLYSIQLRIALTRARHVATISNTVLNELMNINNKSNKSVLPLGAHEWARETKDSKYYSKIKIKYKLPEKYFICISTLEPRKNHINLIKAFALFTKEHPEYKLLIVGKKGWFFEKIFKTVEEENLNDKVIFTGYTPEEDLAGLIDLSKGLIMLSFYEGYGLPIIEALSRKKCVLVSDIPVFKEATNLSKNANFVSPDNIYSISEGMVKLVNQKFLTNSEERVEYSWTPCAKKVLEILKTYQNRLF